MADEEEKKRIVGSEDGQDRITKTRTLYDAGTGEIIWKNFLAGVSRAAGSIFLLIGSTTMSRS